MSIGDLATGLALYVAAIIPLALTPFEYFFSFGNVPASATEIFAALVIGTACVALSETKNDFSVIIYC